MTQQWQLSVDWNDLAMTGRTYADNLVGEPAVSKVMHMMADEIVRLRGQLAWTERERDSLRVSINNLRDYVAELDAELYAASAAKTDTTQPRNGALPTPLAWGVFSDGECYSAFDEEDDARERADMLTAADPEREFHVVPLYAECRHCFAAATPPPHATPPQGSVHGESSLRDSRNAIEPVAWAVVHANGFGGVVDCYTSQQWCKYHFPGKDFRYVPLYRHPSATLTDADIVSLRAEITRLKATAAKLYDIAASSIDWLERRRMLDRLGMDSFSEDG